MLGYLEFACSALIAAVLITAVPGDCGPVRMSAESDWPMPGGGPLRSGRATVKGRIAGSPDIAWTYACGVTPGSSFTADFDQDGTAESYSIENWRLVSRNPDGTKRWESDSITRLCSVVGFEDLDGDGQPEPLMQGTGLNDRVPVFFVFDPATGRIRWKVQLAATNSVQCRLGKIDVNRKGLQMVCGLFPAFGAGAMNFFCWDKGVEEGYELWSWSRADDYIYFPEVIVGDLNGDGQNEILMMSHMCVRMFEVLNGIEISRVAWPPRTRSYNGRFSLYNAKPGVTLSAVIATQYNKVTMVDCDDGKLVVRWNHEFQPGASDDDLRGQLESLHDSVCDLDGNGWAEVVCSYWAGESDRKWRTVVLGSRDGSVQAELVGKVMVGAADVDGDGRVELMLRDQVEKHDYVTGPVGLYRWSRDEGLSLCWTAPFDGEPVREPNEASNYLGSFPDVGTRVKLALASDGTRAFFIKDTKGRIAAFRHSADRGFEQVQDVQAPPDPPRGFRGLVAAQTKPLAPPLVADYNGDGSNEIIAAAPDNAYLVLQPPANGSSAPKVLDQVDGSALPPTFADIDGDGQLEMVIARVAESLDDPGVKQPCVEVRRFGGELLWRRAWPANPFARQGSGFTVHFLAAGHFRSRKTMDVCVSYMGAKTGIRTALLDWSTGETVWEIEKLYPDMYGSCWDAFPPVIFDYDSDGLDDIATVCQTVHYTILRGTDGAQLVKPARDASDQAFGGEPPLFKGAWAVRAQLAGGDADGDGKIDIGVMASQASVGALRANGEEIWRLKLEFSERIAEQPGCWADVNGDGAMEMVFPFKDGFVRVYDPVKGEMLWEQRLDSLGQVSAADVDGDGSDEILFSSEKGALYCLGNLADPVTGSHVKWVAELPGAPGQAVFADVNNDGFGEILVACSDGKLYCLFAGPR